MVILEGIYKGRTITPVKGFETRPMTGRIRKSIFGMIGPEICGIRVLDIFCGSGSMGLEAISRGADKVVFIDKSTKATKAVTDSIARLGCREAACILCADAVSALKTIGGQYELIIVDPPYGSGLGQPVIDALAWRAEMENDGLQSVLSPRGAVFVRHLPAETPVLPDSLVLFRREYRGSDVISIIRKV